MVVETQEHRPGSLTSAHRWDNTIHSLHLAAQHLRALQMLVLDRVPNYLEWALEIHPQGLSTGSLPQIGEVVLVFNKVACTVVRWRARRQKYL